MLKNTLITLAILVAPASAIGGLYVYDTGELTTTYVNDTTLSGHAIISRKLTGRLGTTTYELLGYGHARLIGLGCDGHELGTILIANEEDYFPACDAIEPVKGY